MYQQIIERWLMFLQKISNSRTSLCWVGNHSGWDLSSLLAFIKSFQKYSANRGNTSRPMWRLRRLISHGMRGRQLRHRHRPYSKYERNRFWKAQYRHNHNMPLKWVEDGKQMNEWFQRQRTSPIYLSTFEHRRHFWKCKEHATLRTLTIKPCLGRYGMRGRQLRHRQKWLSDRSRIWPKVFAAILPPWSKRANHSDAVLVYYEANKEGHPHGKTIQPGAHTLQPTSQFTFRFEEWWEEGWEEEKGRSRLWSRVFNELVSIIFKDSIKSILFF